jgi:hypothetical protein
MANGNVTSSSSSVKCYFRGAARPLRARLLHVDQIEPLTDEQLRRLGIKRELDRVGATD